VEHPVEIVYFCFGTIFDSPPDQIYLLTPAIKAGNIIKNE